MERKFILVTNEKYSGLGFAVNEPNVILAYRYEKPHTSEELDSLNLVGEGLVNKLPLEFLLENKQDYYDYYWIWDGNHNYEIHDLLKKHGFKVCDMGGKFTYVLENDREFGLQFAESCGLFAPETFEFTSPEDGIAFLEENEDKAYVFKPSNEDDNSLTYVPINEEPSKANKEIRQYIEAYASHPATWDYILQEKVKGVEVNIEAFFINGEPYFTHANFEDKFNHQGDTGEATGCSFDIDFEIDLTSRLYIETVGKMEDQLSFKNYTGFADANVIIGDNEVYFLEFCFRPGYNMAPNFFYNLSNKSFFETIADMIDGIKDVKCRPGFGASMTVFANKQRLGLPIYYPECFEDKVYLFDAYMDNDILKMAGIGYGDPEILVVLDHGYTIEDSLENVSEIAEEVIFKNCFYRIDAEEGDYKLSPMKRLNALNAMKML
jgi:phosphoribosylamine-glycine ligase